MWSDESGPSQDSISNGKRVPKRRITVVGINAVEEAQQEPGTKNQYCGQLVPHIKQLHKFQV